MVRIKYEGNIKTYADEEDYYRFMLFIQKQMKKAGKSLSILERKYKRSKVKLLDEHLFQEAHS